MPRTRATTRPIGRANSGCPEDAGFVSLASSINSWTDSLRPANAQRSYSPSRFAVMLACSCGSRLTGGSWRAAPGRTPFSAEANLQRSRWSLTRWRCGARSADPARCQRSSPLLPRPVPGLADASGAAGHRGGERWNGWRVRHSHLPRPRGHARRLRRGANGGCLPRVRRRNRRLQPRLEPSRQPGPQPRRVRVLDPQDSEGDALTKPDSAAPIHTRWRKSSHSTGGNQCVEIAHLGAAVAVRDSKNLDGGHLTFGAAEWRTFLDNAKHGSYDQ